MVRCTRGCIGLATSGMRGVASADDEEAPTESAAGHKSTCSEPAPWEGVRGGVDGALRCAASCPLGALAA
jgi:hypothetical protein